MAKPYVDTTNLDALFEALTPKQRMLAMRGAFRKAAKQVRRVALTNLRQSMRSSHDQKDFERGVRAIVWKKKAGFRVTIGWRKANRDGKGEYGMYTSAQQSNAKKPRRMPILAWAEMGTAPRHLKGSGMTRVNVGDRHYTGRIRVRLANGKWISARTRRGVLKPYRFMTKTKMQVSGTMTDRLHQEIIDNIKRTAKRYGCK